MVRVSVDQELIEGTNAPRVLDIVRLTRRSKMCQVLLNSIPRLPLLRETWLVHIK